jgi:hypothetical protein
VNQVTTSRAVLVGTLWVTLPVIAIMFGGWFGLGYALLNTWSLPLDANAWASLGAVLIAILWGPWIAAWVWWSLNVPKWRIWALRHNGNWPEVERAAIAAGLIWNERNWWGRLFARTEIWSTKDRQVQADLMGQQRTR